MDRWNTDETQKASHGNKCKQQNKSTLCVKTVVGLAAAADTKSSPMSTIRLIWTGVGQTTTMLQLHISSWNYRITSHLTLVAPLAIPFVLLPTLFRVLIVEIQQRPYVFSTNGPTFSVLVVPRPGVATVGSSATKWTTPLSGHRNAERGKNAARKLLEADHQSRGKRRVRTMRSKNTQRFCEPNNKQTNLNFALLPGNKAFAEKKKRTKSIWRNKRLWWDIKFSRLMRSKNTISAKAFVKTRCNKLVSVHVGNSWIAAQTSEHITKVTSATSALNITAPHKPGSSLTAFQQTVKLLCSALPDSYTWTSYRSARTKSHWSTYSVTMKE